MLLQKHRSLEEAQTLIESFLRAGATMQLLGLYNLKSAQGRMNHKIDSLAIIPKEWIRHSKAPGPVYLQTNTLRQVMNENTDIIARAIGDALNGIVYEMKVATNLCTRTLEVVQNIHEDFSKFMDHFDERNKPQSLTNIPLHSGQGVFNSDWPESGDFDEKQAITAKKTASVSERGDYDHNRIVWRVDGAESQGELTNVNGRGSRTGRCRATRVTPSGLETCCEADKNEAQHDGVYLHEKDEWCSLGC